MDRRILLAYPTRRTKLGRLKVTYMGRIYFKGGITVC